MCQPNSDSPAERDADCNGKLYAYGNCNGDVYPYSNRNSNTNGHAYRFAKLHAGLHIHIWHRNDYTGSQRHRKPLR